MFGWRRSNEVLFSSASHSRFVALYIHKTSLNNVQLEIFSPKLNSFKALLRLENLQPSSGSLDRVPAPSRTWILHSGMEQWL
jgi:hypothetical protein